MEKQRSLNLSTDESYLVMKVMIVEELMTGDILPVAMFLPFFNLHQPEQVNLLIVQMGGCED